MTIAMEIDQYTDRKIVEAILRRDARVTREYLYRKCYPLFSAVYAKYYTDCESMVEFINEIYLYILVPHRLTGRCKLAGFGFRCSLTMWLKIVAEHFCHHAQRALRRLIELRYLDECPNEEVARLMSLGMANYYNMHLRAKAQFCSALRKEGLL